MTTRDRFSLKFICTTLNQQRQGEFITSRGYRNTIYGTLSSRSIRDRDLVAKIVQIHAENYGVYGVRKIWHALSRRGLQVGREPPRGSYLWQEYRARDVPQSRHAKPEEKIPGQN